MPQSCDLFSLGPLYVSDFLAQDEQPRADPFELRLQMDDDGLVHLAEQPPAGLMWGERYWYRSGVNKTMRRELSDIVASVEQVVDVGAGDVWVDIASNDGTLLSCVDTFDGALGRVRVGVDPAGDSFADEARKHADLIVQEPFTLDVAERIVDKYGQAKVVTCAAMFYDLLDPGPFLWAVRQLLDPNGGVFVLQLAYTPLMLRQLAFDGICHEHARYYTLATLAEELRRLGFRVVDATLNDVNGGSMRVFAAHEGCDGEVGSQPWRDVGKYRVDALLAQEYLDEVNTPDPWMTFWHDVNVLRESVTQFVRDAVRNHKRVWGLGASTKGNTLLQWFGLDDTLIEGIAERQPQKFGLRTVGTDIPIYPEEAFRAANPDYALVLPWAFLGEIRRREADYLASGGRLVVPCPRFEVVGA